MLSIQKMLPGSRANLKPGVFSNHSLVSKPIIGESFINTSFHQNIVNQSEPTTNKQQPLKKSTEVNTYALQLLAQHLQKQQKPQKQKTPIKPNRVTKYASDNNIKRLIDTSTSENARIQKEQAKKTVLTSKTSDKKQQLSKQKSSGKQLNFNVMMTPGKQDSDANFLNSQNHMANLILQNILNKEDFYEKIKRENQEYKEIQTNYEKQLNDFKHNTQKYQQVIQDLQNTLDNERARYGKELLKFQEMIAVIKTLQSINQLYLIYSRLDNLQKEKNRNENQQKQTTDLQQQILHLQNILSSAALSSIDFLGSFQQHAAIIETHGDFEKSMEIIIQILKGSLQLVFEVIQNTQNLHLPILNNCHISDNIDFESFFRQVEKFSTVHQKSNTDESQTNSQELSFRQKPSNPSLQTSLPLSQVQNKQSQNNSKNVSIQEQFQTFLDIKQDEFDEMPIQVQMGSPYFTHSLPLQMIQPEIQSKDKKDLPLQMNHHLKRKQNHDNKAQILILAQNRFQTEFSDTNRTNDLASERQELQKSPKEQSKVEPNLKNFQSFNKNTKVEHLSVVQHQNNSINDSNLYDSLFQEINKNENKPKKSSIHNLKYLDQQITKSFEQEEKSKKKHKEEDQNKTRTSKSTTESDNAIQITQKQVKKSISSDKENQLQNNSKKAIFDHLRDCWAVARFDYVPEKEGDLTFKKGQKIQVLKQNQNGWWIGKSNGKDIGYFPSNYVKVTENETKNQTLF